MIHADWVVPPPTHACAHAHVLCSWSVRASWYKTTAEAGAFWRRYLKILKISLACVKRPWLQSPTKSFFLDFVSLWPKLKGRPMSKKSIYFRSITRISSLFSISNIYIVNLLHPAASAVLPRLICFALHHPAAAPQPLAHRKGCVDGNTDVCTHAIGRTRTNTGIRLYTQRRCIINQKECFSCSRRQERQHFPEETGSWYHFPWKKKIGFLPRCGGARYIVLLKINTFHARRFNKVQHGKKSPLISKA